MVYFSKLHYLYHNFEDFVKEFVKGPSKFAKEFVKASRQIYKLISQNPQTSAVRMAESMGLSARQVQKYLKRLQESGKIMRLGGRKMGEWRIIDEEYVIASDQMYHSYHFEMYRL